MANTKAFLINVLVYDPKGHGFSPHISIRRNCTALGLLAPATHYLSLEEAERHGIRPSEAWLKDYREWNHFQLNPNGFKGHPVFAKVEDLYDFNETGVGLVERLQKELKGNRIIEVEPFLPLYSNMEVGEAVAAWWHIKDKNYGYVVPIQHLPVSDDLKSRLMAWRMRKTYDWLDAAHCESFNREGRDLEEHILWELNVRFQDVADESADQCRVNPKHLEGRQDSVESVYAGVDRMDDDAVVH